MIFLESLQKRPKTNIYLLLQKSYTNGVQTIAEVELINKKTDETGYANAKKTRLKPKTEV